MKRIETERDGPPHATQWPTRSLATALECNDTLVQRVWHDHGLKPHRTKGFKVSNDPRFAEKLMDVVGLYLDPPDHALVLSCDEKSQIQALDRTQKSLPMLARIGGIDREPQSVGRIDVRTKLLGNDNSTSSRARLAAARKSA